MNRQTKSTFRSTTFSVLSLVLTIVVLTAAAPKLSAQAPYFAWAKQTEVSHNGYGNALAADAAGNTYMTGAFSATKDFNPGSETHNLTSAGATDGYVVKLDSSGNFVWALQISGTADEDAVTVSTDRSGNVYIGGIFSSTTCTIGSTTLTRIGTQDAYLLKLASNGTLIWKAQLGGSTSKVDVQSIAIDGTGNVVLGGSFTATADFNPGPGTSTMTCSNSSYESYLCKLTSSGSFVWSRQLSGDMFNGVSALATDASGNVFATGVFETTIDCNPGSGTATLTTAGAVDIFIVKLDGSGNYVWSAQAGGTEPDWARGLGLDPAGNVIVAGTFDGNANFNPGGTPQILTSVGSTPNPDIFILKLSANGSFSWVKQIGSSSPDELGGMTLDGTGNIYTSGTFTGTVDFNPALGTATYLTSGGGTDAFISKLDANGNYAWAAQVKGTTGAAYIDGYSIAVDAKQNVYTTGQFSGMADFDNTSSTLNLNATNGAYYIHKMRSGGASSSVETNADIFCIVQPNPTKGLFKIICKDLKAASLRIKNMSGQIVFQRQNIYGDYIPVDLNEYPPGIYSIELNNGAVRNNTLLVHQ